MEWGERPEPGWSVDGDERVEPLTEDALEHAVRDGSCVAVGPREALILRRILGAKAQASCRHDFEYGGHGTLCCRRCGACRSAPHLIDVEDAVRLMRLAANYAAADERREAARDDLVRAVRDARAKGGKGPNIEALCRMAGISRPSLYGWLARAEEDGEASE
jgi:hypothetical protein